MEHELAKAANLNSYLELPETVNRLSEKLGLTEAKRFRAALSSAMSTNPVLSLDCDFGTVVNAALIGHSLDLPPSPQLGYYYIVPYNNRKRKCKEGQFQIGYKGYIQLAMRSGYYKKLNVSEIKDGEFKSWNPLTEELDVALITDPVERDKAKTVGYCGYFEYLNGFTKTVYWTLGGMEVHADKYSQAYELESDKLLKAGKIPQGELWKYSSFWYADFDMMAKKTVIRSMLGKWGAMSVDMQRAYEQDIKSESVPFTEAQAATSGANQAEAGSETVDADFEPKDKEKPLKWSCGKCKVEFARRKDGGCPECGNKDLIDQHAKTKETKPADGGPNESWLS